LIIWRRFFKLDYTHFDIYNRNEAADYDAIAKTGMAGRASKYYAEIFFGKGIRTCLKYLNGKGSHPKVIL
jgi:hypothetical protein